MRAISQPTQQIASVVSAKTTPDLPFPIRVSVDSPDETQIRLTAPPATPPGDYMVEVTVQYSNGRTEAAVLPVRVDAVTVPLAANSVSRPPVILLNGWKLFCRNTASTLSASVDTFGSLWKLLQTDGAPILFFNNCTYGDVSVEQLAAQLGAYISRLRYTDGTQVPQIDIVAHSMGGLIARAYLAGLQPNGSFAPPDNPKVRKLILIATPNFGSFKAFNIGTQLPEMIPGSTLLARVNSRV